MDQEETIQFKPQMGRAGERKKGARRSFILPPQPASRLEKRNDSVKAALERSGQTRIGFTAWGLRESEKRNQAIGNSRESQMSEKAARQLTRSIPRWF